MRLVDTDVLIDVRRRYPPAIAWLVSLPDRPGVPGSPQAISSYSIPRRVTTRLSVPS
jgi:hypothetical protein